jgi:hypothetical protein
MIVHTLDTITLRQYAKFEKSKEVRYLLRIPAPAFLTEKGLTRFFEEFATTFGEGRKDLEREKAKLMAYNKILLAQAILTGFQLHLGDRMQLEMLKPGMSQHLHNPDIAYYIKEAEAAFMVEIHTLQDITDLRDELERMIDKFNEMFPKIEQKTDKGISMIQFALSVFVILALPFDNRMTLSEFAELKKLANERAKQMNDLKAKTDGSRR